MSDEQGLTDGAAGGAVEAVLLAQLERHPPELTHAALALCVGETIEGGTTHWQAQCVLRLSDDAARTICEHAGDPRHPIMRALADDRAVTGEPVPDLGGPLADRYWCAALACSPAMGAVTRAVLIGLAAEPFTRRSIAALASLADILAATLAGAEAALREHRESDQLALLMRYAANPIVLSDAAAIVSMNGPAARLFDILAIEGDERHQQADLIARNLARLQEFLAEAAHDAGAVHTGELLLIDPRSHEEAVLAIASTHVPDALGGQGGTVSVLHDMTRARELEHHRVRQQLFESEKLAATGRLAASIAHEINNPLEAIKNSLYLLVRQTAPDDPNRQFLDLAQRETERVSRIIRQMLGVSRPSVAFAPVSVNDVLREALQLLEPQLRQSHIVPTVELSDGLPEVLASVDQLKQVFLNLLLNAKEAMPHGGGLLIQTRIAHQGDAEFLAGRHVIVRIRDDGGGIPPDVLPHVFEPFFSTKADRHGTGLGLWVCQDIIKQHGGHILVRSMVGKGTTFLVALPFITAEARRIQGAEG
jgi:signal transduction histidine kinase